MRRTILLLVMAATIATGGTPGGTAAPAPADGDTHGDAAYALAPGDKLRITVYGAPALGGEVGVNTAGNVAMPLLGEIAAEGKTTQQLSAEIGTRLAAGYVKDPRISVEILKYRPYYILGEVNKPGEFPYAENITVQQAVAAAGGYTYRASRRSVYLRRAGGPEVFQKLGRDPVYVRPGDTIRIGERYL